MESKYTFDQLPEAVQHLCKRFDRFEQLMEQLLSNEKNNNKKPKTIQAASEYLDLAIATIYSKVSRGEIPVHKPPGSRRIYFLEDDLIEYLKQGRKESAKDIQGNANQYLKERRDRHG